MTGFLVFLSVKFAIFYGAPRRFCSCNPFIIEWFKSHSLAISLKK